MKTVLEKHLDWIHWHYKDNSGLDYECVVAQLKMLIEESKENFIKDLKTGLGISSELDNAINEIIKEIESK